MDKNLVSVDDLTRQRLGGGEEREPSGAWLKMRELLDEEDKRKKPLAFLYWRRGLYLVGAMLLVASISIGGYNLSSNLWAARFNAFLNPNKLDPAHQPSGIADAPKTADSHTNTQVLDQPKSENPAQTAVNPAVSERTTTSTATKNYAHLHHRIAIAHSAAENEHNEVAATTPATEGSKVQNVLAASSATVAAKGTKMETSPLNANSATSTLPGNTNVAGKNHPHTSAITASNALTNNTSRAVTHRKHSHTTNEKSKIASNKTNAANNVNQNLTSNINVTSNTHENKNSNANEASNTQASNTSNNAVAATKVVSNPKVYGSAARTSDAVAVPAKDSKSVTSAVIRRKQHGVSKTLASKSLTNKAKNTLGAANTETASVARKATSGRKAVAGNSATHEKTANRARTKTNVATATAHRRQPKTDRTTRGSRTVGYKLSSYAAATTKTNVSRSSNKHVKTANSSLANAVAANYNAPARPVKVSVEKMKIYYRQMKTTTNGVNNFDTISIRDFEVAGNSAAEKENERNAGVVNGNYTNGSQGNQSKNTGKTIGKNAPSKPDNATKNAAGTMKDRPDDAVSPGQQASNLSQAFNEIKYKVGAAKFSAGITAGVNSTFMGPNTFKGFQFGLIGNFIFGENWGILAELEYFHRVNNNYTLNNYYYQNSNLALTTYTFSQLQSFELPISIHYKINRFSFFAGINVVYNMGINFSLNNPAVSGSAPAGTENEPKLSVADFNSRFGLGYLFGASYDVSSNVTIDLRNVQSFWQSGNNSANTYVSEQLYESPSLQMSIIYRFGNKKDKK